MNKKNVARVLTGGVALAGAASLAGFLSAIWWPFELACHFRMQYFFLLAAAAIAFGLARRYVRAAVLLLLCGINFATILPLWLTPELPPASASDEPVTRDLRIASINVHARNDDEAALLQFIEREDPDLVLLEEVTPAWARRLAPLGERYPYQILEPRDDNFGIALFSRRELRDARALSLGVAGVPSVEATLSIDGRVLTLVGTHPLIPVGSRLSRLRNDQLQALGRHLGSMRGPRILIGDFNVTPWSSHFTRLLERSGLVDSARGFGWQPTWPAQCPPLLIPIDHCLHSEEIRILDRRLGESIGSDHYPLVVDIALR